MGNGVVGKPYGGFNLSDLENEFLERLDFSIVSVCKPDSSRKDKLYGFTVEFNIHEYDLEDGEDLKIYMDIVPEYCSVLAMPIGDIFYISANISKDKTLFQINSDANNIKRHAMVLIGADGSIWVNDKMSISKVSNNLSDFLINDPKIHYDGHHILTFNY